MSGAPRLCALRRPAARPRSRRAVQPFRDPELDQSLPGDAEALDLAVQRLDDPARKIDVDATGLAAGATHLGPVDELGNILAGLELLRWATILVSG
jgi:hypothetical protein